MKSEHRPSPNPSLYALLRSQGLGFACGQATVALLALGSVVIAATKQGASRAVGLDDMRAFFAAPSAWHFWFYLLVAVLAVYGLNTALATWHSVVAKWPACLKHSSVLGPTFFHLSFLVALLAHALGGFYGAERGVLSVDGQWRSLPDGREARLLSLVEQAAPLGGVAQIEARVELREAGQVRTATLAYNRPLSQNLGSDLGLLLRHDSRLGALRLRLDGQDCMLEPPAAMRCELKRDKSLRLLQLGRMRQDGPALAQVELREGERYLGRQWIREDGAVELPGIGEAQILAFEPRASLLLRFRHAPGNPLALLSALLLVIGVLLMTRRWWQIVAGAQSQAVPSAFQIKT